MNCISSWGKVGTNGQSQIKSFADAAAAEKAGAEVDCGENEEGLRRRSIRDDTDICPVQVIACSEKPFARETNHHLLKTTFPGWQTTPKIILPTEVALTTLSHRRWPGDSVPQENELILLRSVAAHTHRRFKR